MALNELEREGPVVGVGAIVRHEDAVLLVRRGRPPAQGKWAVPGGRVMLGESLTQAAEREILEETGIVIEAGEVVYTFEYIEKQARRVSYHFVVLDLLARYISGQPVAGDDALEAAWIPLSDLGRFSLNSNTRKALKKLFPGEAQ